MADLRYIVVGASAGGVAALKTLVSELPEALDAAIFIVLHVPAGSVSRLPEILNQARRLPAAHAANGERIRGGRLYVAPPDHHLLIDGAYVRVMRGPKENHQRPAIDPLFRSAAMSHDGRVIGVVLTGALDDGTAGLAAIKNAGGIAMVQDPEEAETPDMPRSALAHVDVDFCLPLRAIAAHLTDLVHAPAPPPVASQAGRGSASAQVAALALGEDSESIDRLGAPSPFTCPECSGTLWELDDGELIRYRCRVGHSYTAQSMWTEQSQAVERSFWVALRLLQENASLSRRIASRAADRGHPLLAQRFLNRAAEMESHAANVKDTLLRLENVPGELADASPEPTD